MSDTFWMGPYNVLVSNKLESCVAQDGINIFNRNNHMTETEWKNKYAVQIGNQWFYKEELPNIIREKSFIDQVKEETAKIYYDKDRINIMKAAKLGETSVRLFGKALELRQKMLENEKFNVTYRMNDYDEDDEDEGWNYLVVEW